MIAAPNGEMRKQEDKGQGKNACLQATRVTVIQSPYREWELSLNTFKKPSKNVCVSGVCPLQISLGCV